MPTTTLSLKYIYGIGFVKNFDLTVTDSGLLCEIPLGLSKLLSGEVEGVVLAETSDVVPKTIFSLAKLSGMRMKTNDSVGLRALIICRIDQWRSKLVQKCNKSKHRAFVDESGPHVPADLGDSIRAFKVLPLRHLEAITAESVDRSRLGRVHGLSSRRVTPL